MHFTTTTTIAALGFVLSAAAVPASPSYIVDPAAATDASTVPDSGNPVAADPNVPAGTTGDVNVRNHCGFNVYLYVCGQNPAICTPEYTLAPYTGMYSEPFPTVNNSRSIKMGKTPGEVLKPILQLEYTNIGPTETRSGQVAYDLSEVNGNPFGPYGFLLTSNNDNCFQKECPPPGTHNVCPWVFTNSTNGLVSDCPISSSIGVTLCDSAVGPEESKAGS